MAVQALEEAKESLLARIAWKCCWTSVCCWISVKSFAGMRRIRFSWAGFKGKKNGDLLHAAENAGYEVFLTVDQGIPHHAQSGSRTIAVFVLRSRTNQPEDLRLLVDAVLHVLAGIAPGQIVTIQPSVVGQFDSGRSNKAMISSTDHT
jgi:hypothetical protein